MFSAIFLRLEIQLCRLQSRGFRRKRSIITVSPHYAERPSMVGFVPVACIAC